MVMGRKASQVFTLDEEHTVTSIDEEDIDFIEQRYSEGGTKLKLPPSFATPEELQGRQGGSNAGGREGLQRGMSLTDVLSLCSIVIIRMMMTDRRPLAQAQITTMMGLAMSLQSKHKEAVQVQVVEEDCNGEQAWQMCSVTIILMMVKFWATPPL